MPKCDTSTSFFIYYEIIKFFNRHLKSFIFISFKTCIFECLNEIFVKIYFYLTKL